MDRVKIVVVDWLPFSVYGFTKEIFDGEPFFIVYINAKVSYERQQEAVQHELLHISLLPSERDIFSYHSAFTALGNYIICAHLSSFRNLIDKEKTIEGIFSIAFKLLYSIFLSLIKFQFSGITN